MAQGRGRPIQPRQPRGRPRPRRRTSAAKKRAWFAAFCSIFTGLGQAMNGDVVKGGLLALGTGLSYMFLGGYIGWILSLALVVFSVYDAYHSAPYEIATDDNGKESWGREGIRIAKGVGLFLIVILLAYFVLGRFSIPLYQTFGVDVTNPWEVAKAPAEATWNVTATAATATVDGVRRQYAYFQCQQDALRNNPQNADEQRDLCVARRMHTGECTETAEQRIAQGQLDDDQEQQFIQSCIRRKAGLPQENRTEEERRQGEWDFIAQNYLSIDLRQEYIQNTPYLTPICGQYCLIVETTFENQGDRRMQIKDFLLQLQGENSNLPMIVAPEGKIPNNEKGKKYSLKHYVEGTGRLNPWQHTSTIGTNDDFSDEQVKGWLSTIFEEVNNLPEQELDSAPYLLRPGETQTVTFLANVTQYRTYLRSCVTRQLEQQRERIQQEMEQEGNNISTQQEYCQLQAERQEDYESSQLYNGGRLYANDSRQQQYNYETFPNYANEVCIEGAKQAAMTCTAQAGPGQGIFGLQHRPTPVVKANYSSATSSVLNLYVTNIDYWDDLSTDDKRRKRAEFGCQPVGLGNIDKQRAQNLHDAVSFLLYTDCEIHYYPDESIDNQILIRTQAKGDTRAAGIDGFRIDSIEGVTQGATGAGTSGVCSSSLSSASESDPSIYKGKWFKATGATAQSAWSTPITACLRQIPEVSEQQQQDILNLDLAARYTAQTSQQGEQVIFR